jgi:hypothetical protein
MSSRVRLSYPKVFGGDISELTRRVAELSVRKILGNATTAMLLYLIPVTDLSTRQIMSDLKLFFPFTSSATLRRYTRYLRLVARGVFGLRVRSYMRVKVEATWVIGVSGARPCIATTDALSEWVYYTPFDRFSPTNPSSVIQLALNAYYETIGDAIRVCGSGTPEYTDLKVIIEVNGYGKRYSSTVLHIKGSEVNAVNNLYYSLVNVLGGGSAMPLEIIHTLDNTTLWARRGDIV